MLFRCFQAVRVKNAVILVTLMNLISPSASFASEIHMAAERGDTSLVLAIIGRDLTQRDASDSEGLTALHFAAIFGHKETLQALISVGAQVDVIDQHGDTPLHNAACGGQLLIVRALVEAGADINLLDKDHWTPLAFSVSSGHISTVEALITYGANAYLTNRDGHTPLQIAQRRNRFAIADMLRPQSIAQIHINVASRHYREGNFKYAARGYIWAAENQIAAGLYAEAEESYNIACGAHTHAGNLEAASLSKTLAQASAFLDEGQRNQQLMESHFASALVSVRKGRSLEVLGDEGSLNAASLCHADVNEHLKEAETKEAIAIAAHEHAAVLVVDHALVDALDGREKAATAGAPTDCHNDWVNLLREKAAVIQSSIDHIRARSAQGRSQYEGL